MTWPQTHQLTVYSYEYTVQVVFIRSQPLVAFPYAWMVSLSRAFTQLFIHDFYFAA